MSEARAREEAMSEATAGGDFKINSGDIVRSRYSIGLRGREFVAVRSGDRLEIYRTDVETPIGYITFGSPRSGAIWKSGECVGEYSVDQSGEYVIIPINENRKEPHPIRKTNPVLYLLELLS